MSTLNLSIYVNVYSFYAFQKTVVKLDLRRYSNLAIFQKKRV